jgi:hypothetical protein
MHTVRRPVRRSSRSRVHWDRVAKALLICRRRAGARSGHRQAAGLVLRTSPMARGPFLTHPRARPHPIPATCAHSAARMLRWPACMLRCSRVRPHFLRRKGVISWHILHVSSLRWCPTMLCRSCALPLPHVCSATYSVLSPACAGAMATSGGHPERWRQSKSARAPTTSPPGCIPSLLPYVLCHVHAPRALLRACCALHWIPSLLPVRSAACMLCCQPSSPGCIPLPLPYVLCRAHALLRACCAAPAYVLPLSPSLPVSPSPSLPPSLM